ncbi:hypothetical protein HDU86_004973 [Geranomyces michiganensis]|nr:hypothetical protein HDU86_004973 [Geranomyces michiganensis]
MSENTPILPVIAPAADPEREPLLPVVASTGKPALQLPHRRRRSPLTIITNVVKRVKESLTSNGHGNGAAPIPAAAPVPGAAPVLAVTVVPAPAAAAPTPVLLDAPLSARILDAGSAFFRAVNPCSPRLVDPPALPSHTDQELEQIVTHVSKDFESNQIEVNRSVIRKIIQDATLNAASLSAVCTNFLSNSWRQTDQHVQQTFGTVNAMDNSYTGVPEGIQTFYVHSKAMMASDIVILCDHFACRIHHPMFLARLDAMIAQAEDNTVYFRYLGTVTGPRGPRDRLEEDLMSTSTLFAKVDLLIKDMQEGGELGNESEWSVHEFVRLRSPALGSSDLRTDVVKRVLISIFGWELLINVQRGGIYASYIPSAPDTQLFTAIGTSVVDNLVSLNSSPGLDPLTGCADPRQHPAFNTIKGHFDDVFRFITEHPQLVANRDVGPSTSIAVDTLHQAIPLTRNIQGGTLVLLIGKDLPLEALDPNERDVRFLFSISRAGHLARTMVRQLPNLEQPQAGTHVDILDMLPFDPLWTVDPTASGPAADSMTVGIPHYDPWRDKYGSQPASMRRVMWLSWVATFVLLEKAQRVLCAYEAQAVSEKGKGPPVQTHLELCTEIERVAKAHISSSGVLTALQQAKRDLEGYFQARQPAVQAITSASAVTEAKAVRRIKKSVARSAAVANQFPADGPIGSLTRTAQANALWERCLLPLGKHLPYNGDPKVKKIWMNWAMSHRQGVSLIQAALMRAVCQPQQEANTIVMGSLGLTADDLKDPNAFEEAMHERLERMRQGRAVLAKFQQAQQSRALLRWGMDPQTILERSVMILDGQQAQVLDRTARFDTSLDGTTIAFRFNIPPAVQNTTMTPILRFRDNGIHLINDAGTSLLCNEFQRPY